MKILRQDRDDIRSINTDRNIKQRMEVIDDDEAREVGQDDVHALETGAAARVHDRAPFKHRYEAPLGPNDMLHARDQNADEARWSKFVC